jgi:predicted NUDIX family NTP pyrophosphohydrolase
VAKASCGLLLYRYRATTVAKPEDGFEVLLVHPGGPLWAKKDEGAWSIPKGEIDPGDDPVACARREFEEELGTAPPDGPLTSLGEVTQAGGKRVEAWALNGDLDVTSIKSNDFEMQWPPRSGRRATFPEVDRASWFTAGQARTKLNPAQATFVDRLLEHLGRPSDGDHEERPLPG